MELVYESLFSGDAALEYPRAMTLDFGSLPGQIRADESFIVE